MQLPRICPWLGTNEGELVSAGAEARYTFASVHARAAKVCNAPRGGDDRLIPCLKAEAVVALVQALQPDIGQHRIAASDLAGADALHVFLKRAAIRQTGHTILTLHLMADAVLHVKAHILGRLSEQLTEEQDDEQQHAKLEYCIVPVDVQQAVQDERCHAEHAQCGKRRNMQPKLLRGLLAVRPEQHDQHRRNACRQKQVRQRQHINKPDAEKPVRRALCERVGAEQRNAYIGNELPSAAYRVADKMHHRDRHQHKGVKGNDASGGSIPSVNLIQSGIGQAPQAAQQQKDRHIEEAALADAAAAHVAEDQQRQHSEDDHGEHHDQRKQ